MELKVKLRKDKLAKPEGALGFGSVFTDHMLVIDYAADKGWFDARIEAYKPLAMDPAAMVLHYGQAIFEGLKAYKDKNGDVKMFRPMLNMERLNSSAERMCMPAIDPEFLLKAVARLVDVERDWIPTSEGTSLYIRPFMVATEKGLSVHAAKEYRLMVICSPSGAYYAHGLQPVSLKVEDKYVRAVKGGTGHYKFAGNYASSILASEIAEREGYDQVMWLDAKDRKYVEEVGSMNIFFAFGDKVLTPELGGSILPGITRRSCIEYLTAKGYRVDERKISIDEILKGVKKGTLTEIFGTGTAAVISPVGTFGYNDKLYTVADGSMGKIASMLYDGITGIQLGKTDDPFGWVYPVEKA